jgi:hypothetical protein
MACLSSGETSWFDCHVLVSSLLRGAPTRTPCLSAAHRRVDLVLFCGGQQINLLHSIVEGSCVLRQRVSAGEKRRGKESLFKTNKAERASGWSTSCFLYSFIANGHHLSNVLQNDCAVEVAPSFLTPPLLDQHTDKKTTHKRQT